MYHLEGLVISNSLGAIMLAASGLCSSGYWSWEHNMVSLINNIGRNSRLYSIYSDKIENSTVSCICLIYWCLLFNQLLYLQWISILAKCNAWYIYIWIEFNMVGNRLKMKFSLYWIYLQCINNWVFSSSKQKS